MLGESEMEVKMKGEPHQTSGNIPEKGHQAPDFEAITLNDRVVHIEDYEGEVVLISVFPDIGTSTCSRQTEEFNNWTSKLDDVRILSISTNTKDEQQQWCVGKEIKMDMLRDANRSFGKAYGVFIEDMDKLARSVFVVDRKGQIVYREIVEEMSGEPNYENAVAAARQALANI